MSHAGQQRSRRCVLARWPYATRLRLRRNRRPSDGERAQTGLIVTAGSGNGSGGGADQRRVGADLESVKQDRQRLHTASPVQRFNTDAFGDQALMGLVHYLGFLPELNFLRQLHYLGFHFGADGARIRSGSTVWVLSSAKAVRNDHLGPLGRRERFDRFHSYMIVELSDWHAVGFLRHGLGKVTVCDSELIALNGSSARAVTWLQTQWRLKRHEAAQKRCIMLGIMLARKKRFERVVTAGQL